MANKVTVKQTPDAEIPTEVLANSIVAISEGIRKIRSGRLTDRALFLLIRDAAPTYGAKYRTQSVGLSEIKAVIEGMESLEKTFLKKKSQ